MIPGMRWLAWCLMLGLPGCNHRARIELTRDVGRRYGDVMSEIGRRFERTGRAVASQRWDLAGYDLGELAEVFSTDVPIAVRPPDVRIDLRPGATAFAATYPGPLRNAIEAHDRAAFDAAFARAAEGCNACHRSAGMGFIEIPSVPGLSVPLVGMVAH